MKLVIERAQSSACPTNGVHLITSRMCVLCVCCRATVQVCRVGCVSVATPPLPPPPRLAHRRISLPWRRAPAADCLVAHPSPWVPMAAVNRNRAFAKTGDP